MRQGRGTRVLSGLGVLAAAVWACETSKTPTTIQRDTTAPTFRFTAPPKFPVDTQPIGGGLQFSYSATDNLTVDSVLLTFSGGFVATIDTGFAGTATSLTGSARVDSTRLSGSGGNVTIIGRSKDGAGNVSKPDTITIFLLNLQALSVTLTAPTPGTVASTGKFIPIGATAIQNSGGVRRVGWLLTAVSPTGANQVASQGDSSVVLVAPFPKTLSLPPDSLQVIGATGTFTLEAFAVDSANRRAVSAPVTVTILSPLNDTTPPIVGVQMGTRVEKTDPVIVSATDPSGIADVGVIIFRDTLNGTVLDTTRVSLSGKKTGVSDTFPLGLTIPDDSLPVRIVVQGFACDSSSRHNCGTSGAVDTALVVAGRTSSLPLGGSIADAIYNTNRRELYLTNPTLGRVDVYNLATGSFVPSGILTGGPQPWGIALWPKDTLGGYDDNKVVVANSGGTELSVLDASTRLLLWRQDLPNFLIEKYSVVNTGGVYRPQITVFDVSDRPQYVATVCRVTTGTSTCHADSIFAIYSTTPTVSSSSPFNGRATLRMERLVNPGSPPDTSKLFGHLFWEVWSSGQNVAGDTLRVELVRGLPYNQYQIVLTACAFRTVNIASFGLGDQTFVRNSGDFTHAFIGEGGHITTQFARVFNYSAKQPLIAGDGTTLSCEPVSGYPESGRFDRDFGASPGSLVSDFISNTGIHVLSVATNFNGITNLVRADSIYYLDEGLRLKGTSAVGSSTPGMDMNYKHNFAPSGSCNPTCGGTANTANRMVFAASPDTSILAFDTYFFNQQKAIQIRDPIVGPLRVALDTATNTQYVFAITSRGLAVVTLPSIPNINPQAPPFRTRVSGAGRRRR